MKSTTDVNPNLNNLFMPINKAISNAEANRGDWVIKELNLNEEEISSENSTPVILWLGNAGLGISASKITKLPSPLILSYDSYAYTVINMDLSLLGILQHAAERLKIKHIIVCGYYNSPHIKSVYESEKQKESIPYWMHCLNSVFQQHKEFWEKIPDKNTRLRYLTELSVIDQVESLLKISIIKRVRWNNDHPAIHGWVYNKDTGIIKSLIKK